VDLGLHHLKGIATPERVYAVSGPTIAAPFASTECPYRGLQSFDASDRALFFGREAVVTSMLERLAPAQLLAGVGASGSCKSSLVRAGVVGAVLAGDLPGCTAATVVSPGTGAALPPVGDAGTFVVVDQFEELFTTCESTERRRAYIDALLAHPGP